MRLAVLASGKGSNLAAIADAINRGELNATINVVIYNNPEAGVVPEFRGRIAGRWSLVITVWSITRSSLISLESLL